jgi:hypothetical protein
LQKADVDAQTSCRLASTTSEAKRVSVRHCRVERLQQAALEAYLQMVVGEQARGRG